MEDCSLNLDLSQTIEINLSKDYILSKIQEEEIWTHYGVPAKKGLFCSKLRQDRHPTCSLFRTKNGKLVMKDFGSNWCGDCFAYVSALYNISFNQTLRTIANDFGLIKSNLEKHSAQCKYNGEKIEESKEAIIQVEVRDYQQYELDWWAKYGITENTLKKFRVFSCKNVFLNSNLFHIETDKQLVFGYYGGIKEGTEQWRIYFPGRKKFKFISNWKASQIQGARMLPKEGGDVLVITKSLKDVMCLYEYGIPAIAPNSENLFVTDKQFEKLKKAFKHIILFYDNDCAGVTGMNKIRKQHPEVISMFIPRKYEAKDLSDFRKKYGVKKTQELINAAKQCYIDGK